MKPENIKCPNCDGPMIPRKSRHGVFWGCKKYPECDGTRNSMGEAREDRDEDEDKPERTFSWNRKREI